MNENMSPTFFFMFSKEENSSSFSLTYFMTRIMVLQISSLNTKEEILHFFKSIDL